MSETADQISNLSDKEQKRFYEYVQRSLRRQWAEAKNRTETEIDFENRRRPQ